MKWRVVECFNPYLNKNLYEVWRDGFCLLPPKQFGSYESLEEAKEYIRKYKSAGGVVYSE